MHKFSLIIRGRADGAKGARTFSDRVEDRRSGPAASRPVWGVGVQEAARWAVALTPRTGLSRAERLSLRPEAFDVSPCVRGARVVLVDDVCTTGATLACLARACEAAGASVLGAYAAAGSAG